MRRLVLAFLFLLGLSLKSHCETFQIVGDDDFPPFSFVDNMGQITGIDIEILRELENRLEIEFDIKLVPWKRLLLMTKTGAVFGSFSLFKTSERQAFALFTHPLHYSTYKIFTLSTNRYEFESIKDLYGKRISIAAGFTVSEELEAAQLRGDLTLIETFSFKDSFRRLLKGGVDMVIGNELVVEHQLKHGLASNSDLALIESLNKPIQKSRGAYFVLSEKYPLKDKVKWQTTIERTLKGIEEEGLMDAIVKRYMR